MTTERVPEEPCACGHSHRPDRVCYEEVAVDIECGCIHHRPLTPDPSETSPRTPPPQSEATPPQRDDADRSATLAKSEPLSAEARSNLRRLAEAATPGPWTDETTCVGSAGHGPVAFFGAFADTAFIAAAREAVLALLEENKALRSEVDRLRAEREPNCVAHGSYGRQDFDPDCPRCRIAAALRGTP